MEQSLSIINQIITTFTIETYDLYIKRTTQQFESIINKHSSQHSQDTVTEPATDTILDEQKDDTVVIPVADVYDNDNARELYQI